MFFQKSFAKIAIKYIQEKIDQFLAKENPSFKSKCSRFFDLHSKVSKYCDKCELLSLHQYIDELEVIGSNQPQHSSKFDMMSIVQEEEESEILDESMSERSALNNLLAGFFLAHVLHVILLSGTLGTRGFFLARISLGSVGIGRDRPKADAPSGNANRDLRRHNRYLKPETVQEKPLVPSVT